MEDTHVTAATVPITISGTEFEASPFSDKELDSLTNWLRYQLNKRGREEAEFAENAEEAAEIKHQYLQMSQRLKWYNSEALSLMNTPAGMVEVSYRMIRPMKPDMNKEWLQGKFGTSSDLSNEQLQNIKEVTTAFSQLNFAAKSLNSPKGKASKKSSKKVTKGNSTER